MNKDFLLFIGSLLYILVNVVIFPLVVLVDCLVGLVAAVRYTRVLRRRLARLAFRQRTALNQFLVKHPVSFYKKVVR
jgi:hypothetical protein